MVDEAELAKFLEGCETLLKEQLSAFGAVIEDAWKSDQKISFKEGKFKLKGIAWAGGLQVEIAGKFFYNHELASERTITAIMCVCEYEPKRILQTIEKFKAATAYCLVVLEEHKRKMVLVAREQRQIRENAAWAFDNQRGAVREIKALLVARELREKN